MMECDSAGTTTKNACIFSFSFFFFLLAFSLILVDHNPECILMYEIYNRSGGEILVLEQLYEHMPPCFLDGEIW